MHTVLVLGGYGFFGSRICQALVAGANIHLLIGGRDAGKAQRLAVDLGLPAAHGVAIDADASDLVQRLRALRVATVIHTAGPFQGQDYRVAMAAMAADANYMDLADGREFVAGIGALDAMAKERGLVVTSGASSLPALSSAVVDRYSARFSRVETIRIGIGSGARAPGLTTMRGVFGYCGKPFLRWVDGRWQTAYGWLDMLRYRFPAPVGTRFLGACDVPDLALFPARYAGVQTVTFHAGFAGSPGHLFVWGAAHLVRAGLLSSLRPLVQPLHALSQWLEVLVSDKGGMFVSLAGLDHQGQALKL
ncbi:MAG: saccharopine dehydrogenase NADP-binding domain-containing protein, partial [Burkholderiales bacterium]|nr:saccharopine dehydrogenase NADP-binding domain-containing protein [Burkholderiales bacterium]